MSTVDPQKIRRTRTGLIAHDAALAQPGYTLFAPMYGDGTIYLDAVYARPPTRDALLHLLMATMACKAAVKAGVRSTPTFFINGRRIEGNMPFENWLMAFAVELDKG